MALQPGIRIGSYEVVDLIGAGGMGEVYRARDSKLGRDVAIKLLPDLFATDPERLMRFTREARTLAALNHPHIAQIYNVEGSVLVMELVDGEDLAQRIARAPIPVDDAIAIATQVADALDAAHERGIVHRDLKPANIKVRPDGTVKVLDFGLAKLDAPAEAGALADSEGRGFGPAASRATITSPALTLRGMIMGTATYMAPEQAKGKPVDKRADIWSFGCVLYEMLTGVRAFDGDDVTETLAAVVRAEPSWSALPASVSPALRRVLQRCLVKDSRQRARDIGDVKLQLLEAQKDDAAVAPASPAPRVPRVVVWSAAVAVLALGIAAGAIWSPRATPPSSIALQAAIDLGIEMPPTIAPGPVAVLSPDGTMLVVTGRSQTGKTRQLFFRRLNQLQVNALPGTENARDPFFSPGGDWVAFFADQKLKKVPVAGGPVVTLADAPDDRGGAWGDDDVIVFAPTARSAVFRVPAAGGAAVEETRLGSDETAHRWPQTFAGGKALIYTSVSGGSERVVVKPREGEARVVQQPAYFGRYLPSGHVVYMQDSTLYAARFDAASLTMTSAAVSVIDGVLHPLGPSGAQIAFANTGAAVFLPGGRLAGAQLVWIDASGGVVPLREQTAVFTDPRISPDGRSIASTITTQQRDIWIFDDRGTSSRLTSEPTNEVDPVWTRDGQYVTFAVQSGGRASEIYWKRADGVGEMTLLMRGEKPLLPFSWHPNGKTLAVLQNTATNNTADLYTVDFTFAADGTPNAGPLVPFAVTRFVESEPEFSPDGRWIAYQSDETGQIEVYVAPYGGPGRRVVVSTAGGLFPTWARDGRTLFYRTADQQIMAVTYTITNGMFEASPPVVWTSARLTDMGGRTVRNFDVHPDGRRILGVRIPEEDAAQRTAITYVSDFLSEVRRLTGPNR